MNIYVFHKLIYAFQFVLVVNLIYQIDNQFPIVFYPFLFLHFACPFLSRKYVRFFHYTTRTYFRQLVIFVNLFPKLYHILHRKNRPVHKRGHFFHLYSDSYKSSIFTCKCSANFSIVSILGILLPVAILCSVDLLMPVKISNCLYDNPFLFICSAKSIFISSPIGIFSF